MTITKEEKAKVVEQIKAKLTEAGHEVTETTNYEGVNGYQINGTELTLKVDTYGERWSQNLQIVLGDNSWKPLGKSYRGKAGEFNWKKLMFQIDELLEGSRAKVAERLERKQNQEAAKADNEPRLERIKQEIERLGMSVEIGGWGYGSNIDTTSYEKANSFHARLDLRITELTEDQVILVLNRLAELKDLLGKDILTKR